MMGHEGAREEPFDAPDGAADGAGPSAWDGPSPGRHEAHDGRTKRTENGNSIDGHFGDRTRAPRCPSEFCRLPSLSLFGVAPRALRVIFVFFV